MSATRLARLITRRLYFASAALSTYSEWLFPITDVEVNHADHFGSGGARFGLPCCGLIAPVTANQDFAISDGGGNSNVKKTA
jgi:hypothetical protein